MRFWATLCWLRGKGARLCRGGHAGCWKPGEENAGMAGRGQPGRAEEGELFENLAPGNHVRFLFLFTVRRILVCCGGQGAAVSWLPPELSGLSVPLPDHSLSSAHGNDGSMEATYGVISALFILHPVG